LTSKQWADIKAQGKAIVNFFTEDKIITERFWPEDTTSPLNAD
jgi:malonate-semialdehyde dehydrogenase (acetylating) / methylmalonate-semialdehyde dehydrogenase